MAASFVLRTASDCFTVTSLITGNIGRILRSMNIDYFAMQLTTYGFCRYGPFTLPVFLNKWRASSMISSYKCKLNRKTPFKSFPFD